MKITVNGNEIEASKVEIDVFDYSIEELNDKIEKVECAFNSVDAMLHKITQPWVARDFNNRMYYHRSLTFIDNFYI